MSSTCTIRIILDDKYEKSDLNKVMTEQCQHLSPSKLENILNISKIFEGLFDVPIGTCNTALVDLELKYDANPLCS